MEILRITPSSNVIVINALHTPVLLPCSIRRFAASLRTSGTSLRIILKSIASPGIRPAIRLNIFSSVILRLNCKNNRIQHKKINASCMPKNRDSFVNRHEFHSRSVVGPR